MPAGQSHPGCSAACSDDAPHTDHEAHEDQPWREAHDGDEEDDDGDVGMMMMTMIMLLLMMMMMVMQDCGMHATIHARMQAHAAAAAADAVAAANDDVLQEVSEEPNGCR